MATVDEQSKATEQPREPRRLSQRARILHQISQDTVAKLGTVIILLMVFFAIFATVDDLLFGRDLITSLLHDPFSGDREKRLLGPHLEHPMGTDHQGRDIMARVIYASRTSIAVGLGAVGFAATAGVIIGLVTAYYGHLVDTVGMRMMDVILSFPAILLAIALMAVMGRGVINVVVAIAIVYTPTFARLTRSEVLSKKSEPYVDAARVIGYPNRRIMFREILPNCLTPIIVQFTFSLALAIIVEAALSFLGLGISPPTPSWGRMLSDAREHMRSAWWFSIFPGMAIAVTVLGFNLLGDSIRDALDPQQKRQTEERM